MRMTGNNCLLILSPHFSQWPVTDFCEIVSSSLTKHWCQTSSFSASSSVTCISVNYANIFDIILSLQLVTTLQVLLHHYHYYYKTQHQGSQCVHRWDIPYHFQKTRASFYQYIEWNIVVSHQEEGQTVIIEDMHYEI